MTFVSTDSFLKFSNSSCSPSPLLHPNQQEKKEKPYLRSVQLHFHYQGCKASSPMGHLSFFPSASLPKLQSRSYTPDYNDRGLG